MTTAHLCEVCLAESTLTCSRCRDVCYCGREHQTMHWKVHRELCGSSREVSSKHTKSSSSLCLAAASGDITDVMDAMKKGADPKHPCDDANYTALQVASGNGGINVVEYLVKLGANVNYASQKKKEPPSALHLAAMSGRIVTAKKLLELGADINARDVTEQKTPLYLAVEAGYADTVEMLLESGADAKIPDASGTTPLSVALLKKGSTNGDIIIDLLLSKRRSVMQSFVKECAFGNHDTIKKMLKDDPTLATSKYEGESPLHAAAFSGDKETISLLFSAGTKLDDNDIRNLLSIATKNGSVESMKMLMDAGAKIGLALISAIKNKRRDIVELLLRSGAKTDVYSHDGKTPLIVAAEMGEDDIIGSLLDSGADPNFVPVKVSKFEKMTSPLHTAKMNKHESTIRLLSSRGGRDFM